MKKPQPQIFAPTKKPAVVLVHGFRGSPLGLQAIADELTAAGYSVYVPPIPPFAGAQPLVNYAAQDYADYLCRYISEQNLDHPVLVGHSMGSIVVAAAAELYPEKLNHKLILMSPISVKTAKPFALIAPFSALLPRRIVDYVTTRYLFVPHDRALFRHTLELTRQCSADHPPNRRAVAQAAHFSAHSAVSDFTLRQQVLLLAGEHDRLIKKRSTLKLAEALQAEHTFIPGSGHLHNYEKPHETAVAIRQFLEH